MRKIIALVLILLIMTGCSSKQEIQNNDNQENQMKDNNVDIYENTGTKEEIEDRISIDRVVNCEGCVYAYFATDKTFGSELSKEEYTTDINDIKTKAGNQRHNFFGFVLNDNKIIRAYSCILKDNTIYCIEGTSNGDKYQSNIGVLNQIFTGEQCKYISDGNTYTCTDGHYNGRTNTKGDADLHFETSCRIAVLSKSVKISCA